MDDVASLAANLLETKVLLNSTISDAAQGARFCTGDLKDYFLGSIMPSPEYMKVHLSKFSEDIINQYHKHGFVYI